MQAKDIEQAKPDLHAAQFEALKEHELAVAAYYHNCTEETEKRCDKALDACYELCAINAFGEVTPFISAEQKEALSKVYDEELARLEALDAQPA